MSMWQVLVHVSKPMWQVFGLNWTVAPFLLPLFSLPHFFPHLLLSAPIVYHHISTARNCTVLSPPPIHYAAATDQGFFISTHLRTGFWDQRIEGSAWCEARSNDPRRWWALRLVGAEKPWKNLFIESFILLDRRSKDKNPNNMEVPWLAPGGSGEGVTVRVLQVRTWWWCRGSLWV